MIDGLLDTWGYPITTRFAALPAGRSLPYLTPPRPNLLKNDNNMSSPWGADFGESTDAIHGAELREGLGKLRFAPATEQLYVKLHLERARLRAGMWQSYVVLASIYFTAFRVERFGWYSPISLLHILLLTPAALVTAWAVWSSRFLRWYSPIARFSIPLIGTAAGWFGALDVSSGHVEVMAVLTGQLMCIFLLSGLLFRSAAVAAAMLVAAFVCSGLVLSLPLATLALFSGYLATTASIAATSCWGMEQTSRRSFLMEKVMTELAVRDALTGLWNRRAFERHLRQAWAQAARDQRPIAIVMLDVDHFKCVNDLQGHHGGDELLRRVAQCARDVARRPLDIAARYGGDEFGMLLYDVTSEEASNTTESLRNAVANMHIEYGSGQVQREVTITAGIAALTPTPDRSVDGALQLADQALYQAKRAGRNRCKVLGQLDYEGLDTVVFNDAGSTGAEMDSSPVKPLSPHCAASGKVVMG